MENQVGQKTVPIERQEDIAPKPGFHVFEAAGGAEGAEAEVRDLLVQNAQVADDLTLMAERAEDAEAERDALAARIERVRALTYESSDGHEYPHVPDCVGVETCPACWAAAIFTALDGDGGE